jgi:hypothetical protein
VAEEQKQIVRAAKPGKKVPQIDAPPVQVNGTVEMKVDTRMLEQCDEVFAIPDVNVRLRWGLHPRRNGRVNGSTITLTATALEEGEEAVPIVSRAQGVPFCVINFKIEGQAPPAPPKNYSWANEADAKRLRDAYEKLEQDEKAKDEEYYGMKVGFTLSQTLKPETAWTIAPLDWVRNTLWTVAEEVKELENGQSATNYQDRSKPARRRQLYWMGAEDNVIPSGSVYEFSVKWEESKFELQPGTLPAELVEIIMVVVRLAMETVNCPVPENIGGWIVVCKYDIDDAIGEHADDDYVCEQYPYIVSLTACGEGDFEINATGQQKQNVKVRKADDTVAWIFTQLVRHKLVRTTKAPRISITVRSEFSTPTSCLLHWQSKQCDDEGEDADRATSAWDKLK